jgi:glutamyl-tRNA synthetase
VWLKGYGCVRHTRDAFEWTGDDIDAVRTEDVNVIHWVPADENQPVTLRKPTGDVTGVAEITITEYTTDAIVQFERVGFARIDEHTEDTTIAYFTHP